MNTSDKIARAATSAGAAVKSMAKMALQSRRCTISRHGADEGESIVILANGPSLRTTIAEHAEELAGRATMAVNFAANAPEFTRLRPGRYVLADPHFFNSDEPNVQTLWRNINEASWPLILYVPWAQAARPEHASRPSMPWVWKAPTPSAMPPSAAASACRDRATCSYLP